MRTDHSIYRMTQDNNKGIQATPDHSEKSMTPTRFMLQTARPHMRWGILALILTICAQAVSAMMPYVLGTFVDSIISAGTSDEQKAVFMFWGLIFLAVNFIVYTCTRASGFISIRFLIRQNTTAMRFLFTKATSHSHTYFMNRFAGSVSNKIFNAGDGSIRFMESFLNGVVRQMVIIIVMGFLLLSINSILAIVYFSVISATLGLNALLVKKRRPFVLEFSRASSFLRGGTVDLMTNIQAVRQYVRSDQEHDRIFGDLDDRNNKDVRQWLLAEYIHVINNVIAFILIVVVIGITYYLLRNGLATAGSLAIVMTSMYRVSGVLVDIGDVMNRLLRFYGEVEEGLSDIYLEQEILDIPNAHNLTTTGGQIDWKNVQFKFGNNVVFDNFDVSIAPGQRVGLVGQSGAGKTTFASLLLRQHDIQSGSILIDGQDISQVTQDSLRDHIAVVPQEPLLFHRTIRENIAYGRPDATEEEIVQAAQQAQAHDFILALEEGYDTQVGERGVKLSGGQKQRVAIARAILKQAPILLLDEATSALDSESEVLIQQALEALMECRTVVAIAHRLSTLRKMDRIIVMDAGSIIEDGTHDELSISGGVYQKLWEHQAGGFLTE